MMRVHTTRFGEIEVSTGEIITFPQGILGFEAIKRYVLLGGQKPFSFLQSVDDPDLTFVVMDPLVVRPDYRVEVPASEVKDLGITEASQAIILAIVTVPEDLRQMTVNLQAPLIINSKNRLAKQIVLRDQAYPMRQKVLQVKAKTA